MAEYHLAKVDVARRQLETAIRLYFHDGDSISIHTLVAAARNVLANLCAHRGVTHSLLLDDVMAKYIRLERHRELREVFRAPENFFKHADRDPEDVLKFNPESTDYFFMEAIEGYATLTGEVPPYFAAFRVWWFRLHPDSLNDVTSAKLVQSLKQFPYGLHEKPKFLSDFLPMLAKHGAERTR